MARRKTQNAVYNADGSRFALTADKSSVVDFLKQFNALRYVQGQDANGALLYVGADDKPTTENTGKPFIMARPRSGYTQYFNDDGFTDPISPDALSPQGVGKLMAKLIEVAHSLIAGGGDDATEMKAVLEGIFAFHNESAATFVAEKANQTAVASALEVLTKANGGDTAAAQAKLAAFLGSKGITTLAPTPAVEAEATETVETTETAEVTEVNAETETVETAEVTEVEAEVDSVEETATIADESSVETEPEQTLNA